jgi:hypothetical protein
MLQWLQITQSTMSGRTRVVHMTVQTQRETFTGWNEIRKRDAGTLFQWFQNPNEMLQGGMHKGSFDIAVSKATLLGDTYKQQVYSQRLKRTSTTITICFKGFDSSFYMEIHRECHKKKSSEEAAMNPSKLATIHFQYLEKLKFDVQLEFQPLDEAQIEPRDTIIHLLVEYREKDKPENTKQKIEAQFPIKNLTKTGIRKIARLYHTCNSKFHPGKRLEPRTKELPKA